LDATEENLPGAFNEDVPRRSRSRYPARVLVQPEMEKERSPLVNIPPFGREFKALGSSDPMWLIEKRGSEAAALRSSSR